MSYYGGYGYGSYAPAAAAAGGGGLVKTALILLLIVSIVGAAGFAYLQTNPTLEAGVVSWWDSFIAGLTGGSVSGSGSGQGSGQGSGSGTGDSGSGSGTGEVVTGSTPPNAPTALVVTSATGVGAHVAWTAPASGPHPSSYTLEVSQDTTFATGVTTVTGISGTAYTITGLSQTSVFYYTRVQSVLASNSTDSAYSTAVEFAAPPPPPTAVTVAAAGVGSITASWTVPASSGYAPTNFLSASAQYRVDASPSSTFASGVVSSYTADGTATSYTVTGLLPSTQYYVRVYTTGPYLLTSTAAPSSPSSVTTAPIECDAAAAGAWLMTQGNVGLATVMTANSGTARGWQALEVIPMSNQVWGSAGTDATTNGASWNQVGGYQWGESAVMSRGFVDTSFPSPSAPLYRLNGTVSQYNGGLTGAAVAVFAAYSPCTAARRTGFSWAPMYITGGTPQFFTNSATTPSAGTPTIVAVENSTTTSTNRFFPPAVDSNGVPTANPILITNSAGGNQLWGLASWNTMTTAQANWTVDLTTSLAYLNTQLAPAGAYWEIIIVSVSEGLNNSWGLQVGELTSLNQYSAQLKTGSLTAINGTKTWYPQAPYTSFSAQEPWFSRISPRVRPSWGALPFADTVYSVRVSNTVTSTYTGFG